MKGGSKGSLGQVDYIRGHLREPRKSCNQSRITLIIPTVPQGPLEKRMLIAIINFLDNETAIQIRREFISAAPGAL